VSDAEAEARALKDPTTTLKEEQLKRMALAREVRLIREKTGLSQPQSLPVPHRLARLRDFEQARSEPDFMFVVSANDPRRPSQGDRLSGV